MLHIVKSQYIKQIRVNEGNYVVIDCINGLSIRTSAIGLSVDEVAFGEYTATGDNSIVENVETTNRNRHRSGIDVITD